jgi:PAS domain S-box-containing protein
MKSAKLHSQEADRIEALRSTGLLDTMNEVEYDSITFLASHICQTPIALISLVDSNRQWFKSKVGLSASETPRDLAFCAHAILGEDLFIVEDSTQDQRFFDNPLVQGQPKVIFYAGAPLIDPKTKLPLGTVCVIDHKARTLTDSQKTALKNLSIQVSALIELKQNVQTLQIQQKELIRSKIAIANMQEGFVLQDKSGAIIDFNISASNILGLSADQLKGKTSLDSSWQAVKESGEPLPGHEHPAMVALRTGKNQSGVKMGVKSTHFKERWISINASPIFIDEMDKQPDSVVVTFIDNTELMKTQAKLMDNARLVTLAEMASGIAHEINNPLAIINGLCGSISKNLNDSQIDRNILASNLTKIKDTVFRISKIVRSLQAFSRSGDQEKNSPLNLDSVLRDTLSLCSEKFKFGSIQVRFNIPADISISGNMVRLGQVMLNLLTNSFDAIRERQEKWIQINAEITGETVKLIVKDSGNGIPLEVSEKMFQPFFTTKEVGKGTGLGLSLSRGFMEDMGGNLVYDQNAENTTFILELKKAAQSSEQKSA